MASWPRTILPFEVTSLEMPGPLISKAQSGRVNIRSTQQVGRSWTERFLINVRSVDGRALLAAVDDYWRNGTIFTISHVDHLTPVGTGGGSPVIVSPTAQVVTAPENFAHASWAQSGTPVLTSGQADPFGGTAAYLLDDNDAGGFEFIRGTVLFTGNATKALSLYVRAGTALVSDIRLQDTTAPATRATMRITWTGGVPTTAIISGAGTAFTPIAATGGWYYVSFAATGVVAANTNLFDIAPRTLASAADVGTMYIFGANAWNSPWPFGYIGPSNLVASSKVIYVSGATASVTNWLRAGDIISIGGLSHVHGVTETVNSHPGGYAVIPINPPIFTGGTPANGAAVTITGVTMNACLIEPPTFPTTSGSSNDYGELVIKLSEVL